MFTYHLLGAICLINFVYRFYLLLACGSMLLNTPFGIYSVCLHGILSIYSNPDNILFGLRSVIITIMYHYEVDYRYIIAICYTVLFLSEKKEITKMQLVATIYMLGNINSAFSPLFAIQTSAFLIKTTNTWYLLYTIALFANYLLFPTFSPSFIIYLSFILNIHDRIIFPYKINKYIAWGCHFTIFIIMREYGYENAINYFFLQRYYLWWLFVKLWIIGKSISFEKYFDCFLDKP